ncbi:DUF3967 domain-containing protein [Bacillus pumilus]|uniref:DUF3967 domain-containing protein n=1 Tax=Bacillus pumilus TaxID=1408 RepID=UPI001E28911C|nr:DUF3967 domain-containing protein [Bacillus pumilus]MCC9089609.1 DUF3967 domain-containing protein [Bacillus pumilus]UUD42990.1 DUF3967 domain-containing protein [Bacillus pumilus]
MEFVTSSKLKKQQEYIQSSLIERDKKLLEAIRETQETKKLIAATEQSRRKKKDKKMLVAVLEIAY